MGKVILHIFLQTLLEMFPVSSSGNVFLFLKLLFGQPNNYELMAKHFVLDLLLHGLTVLIVGIYFFKPWFSYLVGFLKLQKKYLELVLFCMVADVITALFYFLFHIVGKHFFPLWFGFFISGCLLWSLRWCSDKSGMWCQSCHPERSLVQSLGQDPGFSFFRFIQFPFLTVCRFILDPDATLRMTGKNKSFYRKSECSESSYQKGRVDNFGDTDSWILRPNQLRMTCARCCNSLINLSHSKVEGVAPGVILSAASGSRLNYKKSLFHFIILGTVQGLALLPGISRFGSTFVAARWLGFKPESAFEVSFLIAWPLMLAGFLKGCWQLHLGPFQHELLNMPVLCSMFLATLLSWFALLWVGKLIARKRLWTFSGWLWAMAIIAWLSL